MKRRRRRAEDDEPALDPDEWVEYGGQRIWAMGYTEGGVPYGLTEGEYEACIAGCIGAPSWARAKQVLRRALSTQDAPEPWIGRVGKLGDGLSRDVFAADARGADGQVQRYAVLLPRRDAPRELGQRTHAEVRLLLALSKAQLPFRVPRPVAVLPTDTGPALVRELIPGFPADLRAGRMHQRTPWDLVASITVALHALDVAAFDWVAGHGSCREHGEARLAELAALGEHPEPVVRDALQWLREHLPPDQPACLLHGDLLGQNMLLTLDEPLGVIDWEYAQRGDPAYDLAIVTRGVRRPFQVDHGLERLLAAYACAARRPVLASEVHFHELCLLLGWLLDREPRGEDDVLVRLRPLLARVQRGC